MQADDTAIVIPDITTHLPILQGIFNDLSAATDLHLNSAKCILIPLGDRTLVSMQGTLATT